MKFNSVSSTTYDGGIIEMQCKDTILDARNTHAIDYERSSTYLLARSTESKTDKFISKIKVPSIKSNFLTRVKMSNNKKWINSSTRTVLRN